LDNLILWEPEITIEPQLEKFILRLKDFVDGDIGDNSKLMESSLKSFEHASKKDRMRHLINHNREPIAKLFFRVGSKIRLSSTIPIF